MLSEKRHWDRLGANMTGVMAADQRILDSNLAGECSRLCVRGGAASDRELAGLTKRLGGVGRSSRSGDVRRLAVELHPSAAGGAAPRAPSRVRRLTPLVTARRAEPPEHLVGIGGQGERIDVRVAGGVQLGGELGPPDRDRALARHAAPPLAQGPPGALRAPGPAGARSDRRLPLTSAITASPPHPLSRGGPQQGGLEVAIQGRMELLGDLGTPGSEGPLIAHPPVRLRASSDAAPRTAITPRTIMRCRRPHMIAIGTAPPQLPAGSRPEGERVDPLVAVRIELSHELGMQRSERLRRANAAPRAPRRWPIGWRRRHELS